MAERWFRVRDRETKRLQALLQSAGCHEGESRAAVRDGKDAILDLLCAADLSERGAATRGEAGPFPDEDAGALSDTSEETEEEREAAGAGPKACPRCGGRLTFTARQTRSADEGMTGFIGCAACGWTRRE